MSEAINLQEAILKEVRRDKVPVTLLVSDGKQQMIYKHAISTLAPMKPLKAAATTA